MGKPIIYIARFIAMGGNRFTRLQRQCGHGEPGPGASAAATAGVTFAVSPFRHSATATDRSPGTTDSDTSFPNA